MFPQAIEELEKAVDLSGGGLDPLIRLGYAYAVTGNQDKAIQIINDLKSISKDEHIPSIAYAMIYIGISDYDLAFEFLEKAYEERSSELLKLKVHPFYDSLRSDPRFITLLKKMNLE
jgi:tetratricopeptide (TPR) repeat protein